MITLCCDPGVRNFAICVMNSNYEMLLWDNFNVLDDDDFHCKEMFKNGKVCNRKCTMKYKKDTQEMNYCCKTHFPKDIPITKNNQFKKKL